MTARLPTYYVSCEPSVDSQTSVPQRKQGWLKRFKFPVPLTVCCLVALFISNLGIELARDKKDLVAQSNDQDWQEIMLLEDEWLLAAL